jgi:TetR/AcrR family transcriptional regulator
MMGQAVRKHDIRVANQTLILEAAERVFALSGFRGATTEQIAQEAGLPKANVHYYFKTKSNIYRDVLRSILNDWMKASSSFEAIKDPEESLRDYIRAKMTYSRQRPHGSRVWAREIMSGAPVIDQFLGTTLKSWVNERTRIIQDWVDSGKIEPVEPQALLYLIWATTQHYADFERQIMILNDGSMMTESQFDERTEEVVKMILRCVGLAT